LTSVRIESNPFELGRFVIKFIDKDNYGLFEIGKNGVHLVDVMAL